MAELSDNQVIEAIKILEGSVQLINAKSITLLKKDHPGYWPILIDRLQVQVFIYESRQIDPDNPKWDEIEVNAAAWSHLLLEKNGILVYKYGSEISGGLRAQFKKHYQVFDKRQEHPPLEKMCPICQAPIDNWRSRYCSQKCRLIARSERRGGKRVVIYPQCLGCGKSLEGKRAGTKTCSINCRKTLSKKGKDSWIIASH